MMTLNRCKENTNAKITWVANALSELYPDIKHGDNLTVIQASIHDMIIRINEKTLGLNKQAMSMIGVKPI